MIEIMVYDSIVIGAGPSGMSACLYLLRAGKSVLLLEKEGIGGQIALSPRLENYPSIVSISGGEFADNLFTQINSLGVVFDFGEVGKVIKEGEGDFSVATKYETFKGRSVILATGCSHRCLNVPGEKELTGQGVSYCAVCDGAFYAGKEVLLIGDANTALQYAVSLSAICAKVHLITLFDRFFADKILQERLLSLPNIAITHELNCTKFERDGGKIKSTFEDKKNGGTVSFSSDGVFVAIGQIPHNEAFADLLDLQKGFIVTNDRMETKTAGVYACGDCRKKDVRQVITATNDGAIAATMCQAYLQGLA